MPIRRDPSGGDVARRRSVFVVWRRMTPPGGAMAGLNESSSVGSDVRDDCRTGSGAPAGMNVSSGFSGEPWAGIGIAPWQATRTEQTRVTAIRTEMTPSDLICYGHVARPRRAALSAGDKADG